MRGRDFLDTARLLVAGATEPFWRSGTVDAYYALLLECRDTLRRWGFQVPRGPGVHAHVRLQLIYAGDPDLKRIGRVLEQLVVLRNLASYDLTPVWQFASPAQGQAALQKATDTLTLLDQIDGDPTRRAAAIASIKP
jgi:hypothetical protein